MERQATWYSLGTEVSNCRNDLSQILKEAKLDYKVIEKPVAVDGISEDDAQRYKAIVRNTDNHLYAIAKRSYTPCQNEEAFSLISELPDDVKIIRAGECGNGFVYMIGQLPEVSVLGDAFAPHIILQNSHNGDFACKVATVPLRIACQNQFNLAFHEANNTITIRHTSGISENISAARATMANVYEYMQTLGEQAERLAATKADVEFVISKLFPIAPDASAAAIERITEAQENFRRLYNADDNSNFKGTAWGVLNAATDYATHLVSPKSKPESRFVASIISPEFLRLAQSLVMAR